MKKKKFLLGLFTVMVAAFMLFGSAGIVDPVFAADPVQDALKNAGVKSNTNIEQSGLYDDFKTIITIVMTIGVLWVVLTIVIGAMLLSSSMGNPQRRTMGIISVLCSAGGAWIIYKAYDIASWVSGIG